MAWWHVLAETDAGRSTERELLDADDLDPADLRTNLREMAMLNRLPGGVGASVASVLSVLDGAGPATVLDAGAGSGDFARRLRARLPAQVVVSDVREEVLAVARRNLRGTDGVTFLRADARALPLADETVDVAHASLLLHHFDPADAVTALRELRRVARRGVVVNDLRRGRLANAITDLTVLGLARGRYTRHDGRLSARRAYTLSELDDVAAAAGLRLVRRSPERWPRVTSVFR
jgi:SAM-dependent methyltransferase